MKQQKTPQSRSSHQKEAKEKKKVAEPQPNKDILRQARQKYEYTEISKVSLTGLDSHNIYGVVIDASFPHKVSEDRYVCSLKIIDPSLNSKSS